MATLQERLTEIMSTKGWTRGDLVRVSGESHSVVSQWLGNSSKLIKSIGKMEAAERIERETGYAALWIAKGLGPKHVPGGHLSGNVTGGSGTWSGGFASVSLDQALPVVLQALQALQGAAAPVREELSQVLALLVRTGSDLYAKRVTELLNPSAMPEPPKPDLARHRM